MVVKMATIETCSGLIGVGEDFALARFPVLGLGGDEFIGCGDRGELSHHLYDVAGVLHSDNLPRHRGETRWCVFDCAGGVVKPVAFRRVRVDSVIGCVRLVYYLRANGPQRGINGQCVEQHGRGIDG